MKKMSLMIVVCLILLSSCSKKAVEGAPSPDGKKSKLTVSVDRSTGLLGDPASTAAAALSSQVKQLTFVIYENQQNTEVARQTQFCTDPQFGQMSFDLSAAEYKVIVVGSKSEFGINKFFHNNDIPVVLPYAEANMQYWQPNSTMADKHYKTDDTFFAKETITVGVSPQFMGIELHRIVGKLEVIVEDLETFWVDLKNEATGYMFDTERSFGTIDNDQHTISNENGPISLYILRTDRPLRIEISYGLSHLQRRTIEVPVYKNKRTIVKGKMFSPVVNSFGVIINDTWLEEPEIVNF